MEIKHFNHTQKDYKITSSDYKTVEKSQDRESIGSAIQRFIHQIMELFISSNRNVALVKTYDFLDESLSDKQRIESFFSLKEMAGHGNGDCFKLETKKGKVHAYIDLDNETISKTLSIDYNEFVKIATNDWFPPSKAIEVEAIFDTFLSHNTLEHLKQASFQQLKLLAKPEYENNFIEATATKSSFQAINLDCTGATNPTLSYVEFDVNTDKMLSILNLKGKNHKIEKLFKVDTPRTTFILNNEKIQREISAKELVIKLKKTATVKQVERLIKTCNQNTLNSLIWNTDFRANNGKKIAAFVSIYGHDTDHTIIEKTQNADIKVKILRHYDAATVSSTDYALIVQEYDINEIFTSMKLNVEFTIGFSGKVKIDKIEVIAGDAPRNHLDISND